MKGISTIVGLTILMAFVGCREENQVNCNQTAPSAKCICTAQYEPVCGCNNETYSNACWAECDGVFQYEDGVCN